MPRPFFHTTAELTVRVVESIYVLRSPSILEVSRFCDIPTGQAQEAVGLACDLGLIKVSGTTYDLANPLARFISSPKDTRKAAILRIVIESYSPFLVFRERLLATGSADMASTQTIAVLDLDRHREDVKDTLLSLATYSGAIKSKGGGKFAQETSSIDIYLQELSRMCDDASAAKEWVNNTFSKFANKVSRNEVVLPLASAIEKAIAGSADDAVTEAGSAFESFLVELALRMGVTLTGATGINSKLDKFRTNNDLPSKLVNAAKYIGHVRNAAGHGIDTEISASWTIQQATGVDFVRVVCSMIRACCVHESRTGHEI